MKDSRRISVFLTKPQLPRRERGFSLYDALTTLTVASVLFSVAVPSFQLLTSSQRMSGAVNSLVTALHLARSEAIKRSERAVLCPSVDSRTCNDNSADATVWEEGYLLYIDRNANHEFDDDDQAIWMAGATEGLRIRSSAHRDHITYLPNGLTSGTNTTFTFCDKGGKGAPRAVIVSNTGRPRTSTSGTGGSALVCPTVS